MNQLDLLEIIHDLAEINQRLSWERSADNELRFRIVKTIEKLEKHLNPALTPPPMPQYSDEDYFGLLPFTFPSLPPTSPPKMPTPPPSPPILMDTSKMIKRKHLTLVWSKKD